MNKERRKEVERAQELLAQLDNLKSEIMEIVSTAASDEQDYYDNMPEAFQESERGQRAQEAAEKLQEVADELENIDLEQLANSLAEAAE